MTEIAIPVKTDFPKCKNNTINYIGELFEVVMGELLNSQSRNGGAGFYKKDADRARDMIEQTVLPLLVIDLQDTPVLAACGPEDEDTPTGQ